MHPFRVADYQFIFAKPVHYFMGKFMVTCKAKVVFYGTTPYSGFHEAMLTARVMHSLPH